MPAQKNKNKITALPEVAPPPASVPYISGSELAALLMDPYRNRTVVVVSCVPGEPLSIDVQKVAALVGPDIHVVEIINGVDTHQLERGLPDRLHIFGTGARVYPHGQQWMGRMPRPHVPRRLAQLPALYESLENEVLAAQHFQAPGRSVTAPLPVLAEAVVKGFPAADRAMVEILPTGIQALVRGEDLLPGIPLGWLLRQGQVLTGILDPVSHVLDVRELLLPHPSPVTVYNHGDVALARVKSVRPDHATVHLWPGSDFRIGVESISSNDLDSAQDLLTEGEVVRVRVLYENGAVRLSMLDVDDDEPAVPAPPLIRGGPPWLDSDRPYANIFTAGSAAASPAPDALEAASTGEHSGAELAPSESLLSPAQRRSALQSTQMQLESARRTIDELLAAAKRQGATDEVARALQDQLIEERKGAAALARLHNTAEHQLEALREELARTKAGLVQLRQQRRSATSRTENTLETLFLDPAEQFSFDILQAWAHMVPPAEKAAHPLGQYSTSALFLDSWTELTEQQRIKSLRAVVDLVAGRKGPLHRREPHHLRLNEGAHAGPTVRGGDVCWRLYIEHGTAGALRLHYWKLQAGGIELHEVVPHDVVKP